MAETRPTAKPDQRSDFNSLAADYARFRTSYSDELFDVILGFGPTPAGGRVLDLACGTGLGMAAYVRRGFSVVGTDVAPAMIEHARSTMPEGARVEFVVSRAEALPFPDASFDLVSCAQAFHWFEPQAAFAQCARVLKPGATLAIFWKHAVSSDAFTHTCEQIIREWLGDEAAARSRDHADENESGWPTFWQFAAAAGEAADGRAFCDGEKRLIEFELQRSAEEYVGYQRSREKIRTVLGERRPQFLGELERRLAAAVPADVRLTQRQIQYVFLARRAKP